MRYDSLTYDELERIHTAEPNNLNVAIALAAAAKKRIAELESEVVALKAEIRQSELEHDRKINSIRGLIDG